MKILGIESSCDETAAAVVEDGHKIISSVVATQIPFHEAYKGVVPEIASRSTPNGYCRLSKPLCRKRVKRCNR